jgi:acyl carrier protein
MEDRIKRVMSQVLGVPADKITPESSQDTIERWDSIGHMNLCLALEEEFEISFDDQQVVSMTNYASIVQTISLVSAA